MDYDPRYLGSDALSTYSWAEAFLQERHWGSDGYISINLKYQENNFNHKIQECEGSDVVNVMHQ